MLARRIESYPSRLRNAVTDAMPTSFRMAFPDLYVKHVPSSLQRLTESIFDFPIPACVRANPLLFIHIPKNAGSTISTQLYGAHRGHRSALFYLQADPIYFRSKLVFAIVRNPWSRVVSAYEFGRALSRNHRPYLPETRSVFQKYRTFSDFVNKYLWENKDILDSLDPIFRSQSNYICDARGNILTKI